MTTQNDDPYSATIAALEAKVAEDVAVINKLKRERAIHRGEPLPPVAPPPTQQPDIVALDHRGTVVVVEAKSSHEGAELAQVGINQLEIANCLMTAREIASALARNGVQFATRDPAYSVNVALKTYGRDRIILAGFGKWGLRKWFSPTELEQLEQQWGGMGGRTRDAHATLTSEAVRKRLERGESWGKRRTVTAEHMAKTYEALRNGSSKKGAAEKSEISLATFYWYWRRFKMEEWKPGCDWPPQRREVELTGPIPRELWNTWYGESGHKNGKEPQMFSATPSRFPVGGTH